MYLPKVHNVIKKTTKKRPDLHQVLSFFRLEEPCQQFDESLHKRRINILSFKFSEPKTVDSLPAVVGSPANGADYQTEVRRVQLYKDGIHIIEQNTISGILLLQELEPQLGFCSHGSIGP